MRQTWCNTAMVGIVMIIALASRLAYSENIALRLVYSDVEAFPIQMGNGVKIAQPPGIAVELIERAASDLGLSIIFARRPNKRVLQELQADLADGAFCYSFRETRNQYGHYPMSEGKVDSRRRITSISYYLYKKKGSQLTWDGEQFINLQGKLGGNSGYSIVADLRNRGIEVEEAKTTRQNFIKLQEGRITGYAMQDITADFYAESGQYGEIVKVPTPLATKDYFLILSHGFVQRRPEIAEKLWTKIGEIRDSLTKQVAVKYQLLRD